LGVVEVLVKLQKFVRTEFVHRFANPSVLGILALGQGRVLVYRMVVVGFAPVV
jgi:hypothetical protein